MPTRQEVIEQVWRIAALSPSAPAIGSPVDLQEAHRQATYDSLMRHYKTCFLDESNVQVTVRFIYNQPLITGAVGGWVVKIQADTIFMNSNVFQTINWLWEQAYLPIVEEEMLNGILGCVHAEGIGKDESRPV